MPKQSTKSRKVVATDPVPHAPGVTYADLACVRRSHQGVIQAGTLLAYDGAWDRKAVVAYVYYDGCYTDKYDRTQHEYTVGLQVLGHMYADGRLAARPQPVREVKLTTSTGTCSYHDLGRYTPVLPHKRPAKGQPLQMGNDCAQPEQLQQQGHSLYGLHGYPLAASNGGPSQQQIAEHNVKQAAARKKPTPAPEAVLDQFIIH